MKILGMGAPELVIVGIPLMIAIGFGVLAKSFGAKKGYGSAVCFLAGFFLSAIGFIIVLLLPDKNEEKGRVVNELASYSQLL